jgi:hypothetical protein
MMMPPSRKPIRRALEARTPYMPASEGLTTDREGRQAQRRFILASSLAFVGLLLFWFDSPISNMLALVHGPIALLAVVFLFVATISFALQFFARHRVAHADVGTLASPESELPASETRASIARAIAEDIAFLSRFKADIQAHFDGDATEALRSRISRSMPRAKSILLKANTLKSVTTPA